MTPVGAAVHDGDDHVALFALNYVPGFRRLNVWQVGHLWVKRVVGNVDDLPNRQRLCVHHARHAAELGCHAPGRDRTTVAQQIDGAQTLQRGVRAFAGRLLQKRKGRLQRDGLEAGQRAVQQRTAGLSGLQRDRGLELDHHHAGLHRRLGGTVGSGRPDEYTREQQCEKDGSQSETHGFRRFAKRLSLQNNARPGLNPARRGDAVRSRVRADPAIWPPPSSDPFRPDRPRPGCGPARPAALRCAGSGE